jgi:hypothetical protein
VADVLRRPLALAPAIALTLVLAGCASTPPSTLHPVSTSSLPLGCVPDAATRKCDAFGTYYKGDDLRSTGAQHIGAALNMVDPQLTH